MAGIDGLMQVNIMQEVVPNALIGRELEILSPGLFLIGIIVIPHIAGKIPLFKIGRT